MPRVRHKIELPRQTFIHECYTPRRRNHWQSKKEGPGEERTNHSTSQPYTYNIHHNVANRTRSNAQDQPTRSTVVEASSGPQPHQPDRTHRNSFQHLGQFSSPRLADKNPLLMSTPQRGSSNSKTPINYHDLVFFVDPHQHLITPRAARRSPQAIAPHAMASDVRCACRRRDLPAKASTCTGPSPRKRSRIARQQRDKPYSTSRDQIKEPSQKYTYHGGGTFLNFQPCDQYEGVFCLTVPNKLPRRACFVCT